MAAEGKRVYMLTAKGNAELTGANSSLTVDDLAPVDPGPLALAGLAGFLCFLSVGGVALLVSSLVRTGGRAIGWAAGFLLVSYAVDYLAQVWSIAEPLGPLSIFHYLDPPGILGRGTMGPEDALALAGLALVTTAVALARMGRSDLIGRGSQQLIPAQQPAGWVDKSAAKGGNAPVTHGKHKPRRGLAVTQHTGLPPRRAR